MNIDKIYLFFLLVILIVCFVVTTRRASFIESEIGFLVSLYVLSACSSIIISFLGYKGAYPVSLLSILIIGCYFVVYIYPMAYFSRTKVEVVSSGGLHALICVAAWILAMGGMFSIFQMLPYAIAMLSGDIEVNRIKVVHVKGFRLEPSGLAGTFATAFAVFFGQAQLIAFYIKTSPKKVRFKNLLFWLLIFSSLSYVVLVLTFAGRDGVIYWLFSICFISVLFKRLTCFSFFKSYRFAILALGLLLFIPFFMITASRFKGDWLYSILSYFGQMPYNFSDLFLIAPPPALGDLNFSVIKNVLFAVDYDVDYYNSIYFAHDAVPWVFSYFFGSLVKDFGFLMTFGLIMTFSLMLLCIVFNVKRTKVLYFDQLLLVYFYAQIGLMGLFYFKHQSLNSYLISFWLIYFFVLVCRILIRYRTIRVGKTVVIEN